MAVLLFPGKLGYNSRGKGMFKLFIDVFQKLIKVDDTPQRLALAYALGVFLAFSPLIGLHTLLGLILAFLFGLSRLAVIAGVYTNTPWTVVPYYAFAIWLGNRMFPDCRFLDPTLLQFQFKDLWTYTFWATLLSDWQILIPFFVGSTVLAVILALFSYPFSLAFILYLKRSQGSNR
jgi:uncharacterized protein (DUF2062 family)